MITKITYQLWNWKIISFLLSESVLSCGTVRCPTRSVTNCHARLFTSKRASSVDHVIWRHNPLKRAYGSWLVKNSFQPQKSLKSAKKRNVFLGYKREAHKRHLLLNPKLKMTFFFAETENDICWAQNQRKTTHQPNFVLSKKSAWCVLTIGLGLIVFVVNLQNFNVVIPSFWDVGKQVLFTLSKGRAHNLFSSCCVLQRGWWG